MRERGEGEEIYHIIPSVDFFMPEDSLLKYFVFVPVACEALIFVVTCCLLLGLQKLGGGGKEGKRSREGLQVGVRRRESQSALILARS